MDSTERDDFDEFLKKHSEQFEMPASKGRWSAVSKGVQKNFRKSIYTAVSFFAIVFSGLYFSSLKESIVKPVASINNKIENNIVNLLPQKNNFMNSITNPLSSVGIASPPNAFWTRNDGELQNFIPSSLSEVISKNIPKENEEKISNPSIKNISFLLGENKFNNGNFPSNKIKIPKAKSHKIIYSFFTSAGISSAINTSRGAAHSSEAGVPAYAKIFSYGVGLSIEKRFCKNWLLGTGINYVEEGYGITHHLTKNAFNNSLYNEAKNISSNHEFSFVEIPMNVTRILSHNKMQFSVTAGVSYSRLTRLDLPGEINPLIENTTFRRNNFSVLLQPKIFLKICKSNISIGPELKVKLRSSYESGYSQQEHLYSACLKTAIVF